MTKRECAIVEAFTGIAMCCGDDRRYFYRYVEEIMGRPMLTHEHAIYADQIKEKAQTDFIDLCKNSTEDDVIGCYYVAYVACNTKECRYNNKNGYCLHSPQLNDNGECEDYIFWGKDDD